MLDGPGYTFSILFSAMLQGTPLFVILWMLNVFDQGFEIQEPCLLNVSQWSVVYVEYT